MAEPVELLVPGGLPFNIATTESEATINVQTQNKQQSPSTKQSGNYTDEQIRGIIAKIQNNRSLTKEQRIQQFNDEKLKMMNSIYNNYNSNKSSYFEKFTQDQKTYYKLDMSRGVSRQESEKCFTSQSDAEKAFYEIIKLRAEKQTEDSFKRSMDMLRSNPSMLQSYNLSAKKDEIQSAKAKLIHDKDLLIAKKKEQEKMIQETEQQLLTKIRISDESTQREYSTAVTLANLKQAELNSYTQSKNAEMMLAAQQNTTDTLKTTVQFIANTVVGIDERNRLAKIKSDEELQAILRQMNENSAKAADSQAKAIDAAQKLAAEQAKAAAKAADSQLKALENAAKAADVQNQAIKNLQEEAERRKKESEKINQEAKDAKAKSEEENKKLKEAIAKVDADGKAAAEGLQAGIDKLALDMAEKLKALEDGLQVIKGNFEKDKNVVLPPKLLGDILDNIFKCPKGVPWKLQYNDSRHYTDKETEQQMNNFQSKKYRRYNTYFSRNYLTCGSGHIICLYDFNQMLIQNGIPQVDWTDPTGNNGVRDRFGKVAVSQTYLFHFNTKDNMHYPVIDEFPPF